MTVPAAPEIATLREALELGRRMAWAPEPNLWTRALTRLDSLEARLRDTETALREARDLAVTVADKQLGSLSTRARAIQGLANSVLGDLPTTDEVAGILAPPDPPGGK